MLALSCSICYCASLSGNWNGWKEVACSVSSNNAGIKTLSALSLTMFSIRSDKLQKHKPYTEWKPYTERKLYLCGNKSCYRRLFMAPHVPVSFWPRFISKCPSSKYFCHILVSCGKDVTVKSCGTVNQRVDETLFQWQYGKEKIQLFVWWPHFSLSQQNQSVMNYLPVWQSRAYSQKIHVLA